jgi:hypothetical protein
VNEDCPSKDEILGEIWNEFGRSNNQFSSFVTLVNPRNPGIFEVNQPPPARPHYTSTTTSTPPLPYSGDTSTAPPQAFPVPPPSQRPHSQLPSLDSVHSVTPPRPETLPPTKLPSLDSVHSVTPFVPYSPGWTGKFSEYRSDDIGQTDAKKE